MAPAPDADVIVIGAGPAGAVLTLALSRLGSRVTLVERSSFPRDKPCGEGLMPVGGRVLKDLGIDLGRLGYPAVHGVRYRLPGGRSVAGGLGPDPGFGVRRLRFDADLVELVAAAPGVRLESGCTAHSLRAGRESVEVETSRGRLRSSALVAADGLRSAFAHQVGWSRPPRPPYRYAMVGHLEAPGYAQEEIVVSLLPGREVYTAPAGGGQVLAAVLGGRGGLRTGGLTVAQSYRETVEEAHPELAGAAISPISGAGPFWRRPARVAKGRIFLIGDAAGFLDPLTGDAMAASMAAAAELARYLTSGLEGAAFRYARWHARQWRRRWLITSLALLLTGDRRRAERAFAGVSRRPAALDSLLQVNGGSRALSQVGVRDWAALAGI